MIAAEVLPRYRAGNSPAAERLTPDVNVEYEDAVLFAEDFRRLMAEVDSLKLSALSGHSLTP